MQDTEIITLAIIFNYRDKYLSGSASLILKELNLN